MTNQAQQLRLLSMNMYMRPFVYSNNGDFKEERLEVFYQTVLDKFDVIALQEMFSLGSHNRKQLLINLSKKKGFAHHAALGSSWSSFKPIDSGLLILSRYPIIESDSIAFSKGMNIDGWSNKGVLSALIQYPCVSGENIKVLVITTHTQADYDSNNTQYFEVQLQQVAELRDFVKKKHVQYPNVPILLVGDFNINARVSPDSDGKEHSSGYKKLMDLLNFEIDHEKVEWRDLIYEQMGYHPVTFADTVQDPETGETKPRDIVLTNKVILGQRLYLDYIFYYNKNSQKVSVLNTQVEPFFVDGHPFGQLSDHYGVSTMLSITCD
jgi:endonuclease/exonuclease/phosphatase family metal-dependent hydrolase